MLGPMRDIAVCIGFLTRLPLPSTRSDAGDLARAMWAAPVVGALVGLGGAAAYAAAHALGLPPTVAAISALAATLLLTGCLHEDGLADMADGFGGGRTRERKLEVMRDSRLGTYGACALLLSLLLRWALLAALAEPISVATVLVATHAAARATIPAFMRWVPRARADGLSAGAGAPPVASVVAAALLGILGSLLLGGYRTLAVTALLPIWAVLLANLSRRQIGGQTGDVLGGLEQGGEIIVLAVAVSAFG
jgi:adenosylcobinamide-GDP ribazoletransferase